MVREKSIFLFHFSSKNQNLTHHTEPDRRRMSKLCEITGVTVIAVVVTAKKVLGKKVFLSK